MKMFDGRVGGRTNVEAQRAAQAYAATGGQALHVWDPDAYGWRERNDIPRCFRENTPWAHLVDLDEARLRATVRRLGVNVVRVERRGQAFQHVDLCGAPLARAIMEAEEEQATVTLSQFKISDDDPESGSSPRA